jgi:hypothetical protein
MPVKGGYLLAAGGGVILVWSGLRGKSWSAALRDVISGKKPEHLQTTAAIISSPQAATAGGLSTPSDLPAGGSSAKNKAIGRALAAPYGWSTGAQWNALVALWTRESGWNNRAKNAGSGAYGIPQALPASKMGAAANPPLSSAGAQIRWGLSYIKQRYGNPVNAEAHEQSNGWY